MNTFQIPQAVQAASFLTERLTDFASSVVSIVPEGYNTYLRILHPATKKGVPSHLMSWTEIGHGLEYEVNGSTQWETLVNLPHASKIMSEIEHPQEGTLPLNVAEALRNVLSLYSSTTNQACYYGVWIGFGCLTSEVTRGPLFEIPERQFHLLEGSLELLTKSCSNDIYQSVNLCWPTTNEWCIATEIDFNSTYIACDDKLAKLMLSNSELEIFRVSQTDKVNLG